MLQRARLMVDRDMLLPKAFYCAYYGALAALSPYLALHYRALGLSGRQIGLLLGLPPLVMLVGGPLWGAVADATGARRGVLVTSIIGAVTCMLAVSRLQSVLLLVPAVALYALFASPIAAIVDSSVLHALGPRRERYGLQRLWGAVGWGLVAPVVGAITQRAGLQWSFRSYFPLMACCLFLVLRLPIGGEARRAAFWSGLRTLGGNKRWAAFLVTAFLGGLGASAAHNYLFLHLQALGAPNTLMGISLSVASVGEVLMFAYAGRLMRRWGPRGLLIGSLVATPLRFFALSAIRVPWLVLPLQLLHGPAFSGMWAAGVAYAGESAPPGMSATAQALFGAANMGLASACGGLLGGWVYETWGTAYLFRLAGIVVLVALGFQLLSERALSRNVRPAPTP